jgi:AcrR family transcriptional regulator
MKRKIRNIILETSQRLFFEKGYKKVTVDEIAASISISKKTIYKYFSGKREILEETFEFYRENISKDINAILNMADLSFPEKLKKVLSTIGIHMGGMNSLLVRDIQEYVPELWEKINNYKHEAAYLRFNKLIEEGKRKGHIKSEVNRSVVVALYASAIENLLDPSFIKCFPEELKSEIHQLPIEVFENAIKIIYEGILTPRTIRSLY